MRKRLQSWFIGDYLQNTPDTIEQARLVLIYHILLITPILIVATLPSMVLNGLYIQLIRSSIVVGIFIILLFSLKFHTSVNFISHSIMAVSTLYLIFNIYIIFQQVDESSSYLLSSVNILFAFYFFRWRWVIVYVAINVLAVILFLVLDHFDVYHIGIPPRRIVFDVYFFTILTFYILISMILWHFRTAFNLSSESLKNALLQQQQISQEYQLLNQELQEAKLKAEEMNRLKTNFLNNMSHEIRTPLNGILGIAQIIEDETDNREIKEYITIQKKSGERLLNTINSILHLARLEAEPSQFQLEKIEINQLVEECFIALKTLAQQKKLSYTFSPHPAPLYCWGDATLLYQVMNNLIGNAIKFTPAGNIAISTGIFEKNTDFLFIRIQDTGIGISQEFLTKLFNPFLQESTGQNRQYEGSGLGLSIAQKYVELLGGNIVVESEKGIGSTFTVLLPLNH